MWSGSGVAATIVLTVAGFSLAVGEPTAELEASYTLAQIGLMLSAAYAEHGGIDLIGTTLYGVKVYKVTYTPGEAGASTPQAGRAISLTGLLMVPNRRSSTLPVAAFLHATTTVTASVPSNGFKNCASGLSATAAGVATAVGTAGATCIPDASDGMAAIFSGLATASMGYVAIVPDGTGYGDSASSTAPAYCIAEDYAVSVFNLYAAARALVPQLQSGAAVSSHLVVGGYSEGGYAALAVHREAADPRWAEANVEIGASFPMAGPYDLISTELIAAVNNPSDVSRPSYVLYLAYSYGMTLFGGLEPLIDGAYIERMQVWYEGTNSAYDIDSDIHSYTGNNFLSIFNATMISDIRAGVSTAFTDALNDNTLVDGWAPSSGSSINMCHGAADEVVLLSNAERVLAAMQARGASVGLETVSASVCNSHADCASYCLRHTLTAVWKHEGKWQGALQNDGGISDAATIGAVVGAGLILAILLYVYKRTRGDRNDYSMIA